MLKSTFLIKHINWLGIFTCLVLFITCKDEVAVCVDDLETETFEERESIAEECLEPLILSKVHSIEDPLIKAIPESQILKVDDLLTLESEYLEMLKPISALKESDPKIYWFIVSWLKTNYKTPNWKGYGEPGWKQKAKQRGIDCSGFARIMHDEIFHNSIKGGSRGILKKYCDKINFEDRTMGDLLFFKAPNATKERIVHVGVFLKDKFFVHATSARSAAQGFGLRIDSLDNKRWDDELVAIGRVKNDYRILNNK